MPLRLLLKILIHFWSYLSERGFNKEDGAKGI